MTTDERLFVCRSDEVSEGCGKSVEVGSLQIAVFNISGTFYAIDDICTHGLARLAEGFVEGDIVECPAHFGAFHIPSGEAITAPCSVAVNTYPIMEENGSIYIKV